MFNKNIHPVERFIRILVGTVILCMSFVGPKSPWYFLGAIPLLTGLMGWCPPYQIFGISTCSTKENNED